MSKRAKPPIIAPIIVPIEMPSLFVAAGGEFNTPEGIGELSEETDLTATEIEDSGTEATDAIILTTDVLELIPLIALTIVEDVDVVAETRIETRMLPDPVSERASMPLPSTNRRRR